MRGLKVLILASLMACNEEDAPQPLPEVDPLDTSDLWVDTDPPAEAVLEPTLGFSGQVTWSVDFDANAEGAGFVDCSYQREYSGGFQTTHQLWLCRSCDVMGPADVQMVEGLNSCYRQIFVGATPSGRELMGWNASGTWYRATDTLYSLGNGGSAVVTDESVTISNNYAYEFSDTSGTTRHAQFNVAGELALATIEADSLSGYRPPVHYDCGWPTSEAPPYEGGTVLTVGETLPDGAFVDPCSEPLRLHDLKGRWLVIIFAGLNNGPSRTMASETPAFIDDMAAAGFEVLPVTFLAHHTDQPREDASVSELYDWQFLYDLTHPVLKGRGYGYYVVASGAANIAGADWAWPSWVVVDPDLMVVSAGVGFSSWDPIEDAILTAP